MKEKIQFLALQAASEAFGNRLPNNWESLDEQEQNDWSDTNRWEYTENLSTDEYFSLIDCHADTIKQAMHTAITLMLDDLET